jgi:hypothetical protein
MNEHSYENDLIEKEDKHTFNVTQMLFIRDKIESLNKINHVEVLRILNKDKKVILNENKYGVHINLSELDDNIIKELMEYINYIETQESSLNHDEQQKETFKSIYFTKDIKDNLEKYNIHESY